MSNSTRLHRRGIYRRPSSRYAYRRIRRSQVRRIVRVFQAMYRA